MGRRMSSSLCKRLSHCYTGNRPSNLIANWFLIFAQLKIGAVHLFVIPAVMLPTIWSSGNVRILPICLDFCQARLNSDGV